MIIQKDLPQTNCKIKPTTFPVYNGDKLMYPAWRRAVLSILKMDWLTFGYTDSRVFLMIYKALEGKAQKRAAAYFESGGLQGKETPEDFIKFLDRGNWDQTRMVRAKAELYEMKMGPKQSWSSFYHSWANKLTEASGDNWPEDVKVSLLGGTLNQTLRTALASNHLIPDDDFTEYVRIVSKISQQHEGIHKSAHTRNFDLQNFHCLKSGPASGSNANENRDYNHQDWSRSGIDYGYAGKIDSGGTQLWEELML